MTDWIIFITILAVAIFIAIGNDRDGRSS